MWFGSEIDDDELRELDEGSARGYNRMNTTHWAWDAMDVADNLNQIGRKEAGSFLNDLCTCERYLDSFVDADSLLECFDWSQSPQGHGFWEECFWELVGAGAETTPDELFEDTDATGQTI